MLGKLSKLLCKKIVTVYVCPAAEPFLFMMRGSGGKGSFWLFSGE